jgi:hypothetical protein
MRRLFPIGLVAVLLCLLAGCEPQKSLFPLATDQDKVFESQLLGQWKIWTGTELKPGEKPGIITFSKYNDPYIYDVRIPNFGDDGSTTLTSRAKLVKLGNVLFVDFEAPDLDKLPRFPYPAVESHVFGKLSLENDKARIDFLSDDWVQDNIQAGKLPLAFVPLQGPVLSASTTDLRKFAQDHADDPKAFSEVMSLARNN